MPFSKYIYELLLDNEVVIIPDFGAFVTWIKPARIDEKQGTMLPPSKVVRFDPKIRNNDWLLVNHITESEGITELDALRKIRKVCDEILYRLDNGEHVSFERTGTLYFDDNKELCFVQDEEASLLLESYGLEPVPINHPESIPELKSEENEETVPNHKKSNNFWWWLVIIPVFAGAWLVYMYFNKPETEKTGETQQSEIQQDSVNQAQSDSSNIQGDSLEKSAVPMKSWSNIVGESSVNADSTWQINTDLETQEVPLSRADTIRGKKYYVIGGSFAGEENALKYVKLMESKGYKPFIVEKRGRLYIVAVEVYRTNQQAMDLRRKLMSENPAAGIWILVQ